MRQRSFLNKKFKIIFPAFLILVPALLMILISNSDAKFNEVYLIKINDDTINPVTADYIINSIDKAGQVNAECLIIELDTPGGLLSSTRLIVKKISQAKIPVVVYVYPAGSRAGSAGVFITYASHIAAMAPSTNIGAAHPVNMGGKERSIWDALRDLIDSFSNQEKQTQQKESPDIMADKVLQDSLAFIKALAEEKNRNSSWAEKSVAESASITAEEARKIGVIEIIAKDELELLQQLNARTVKVGGKTKTLNTRGAVIKYIDMTSRERVLNVLANPNIAYILMILGFYGLFFEITHPGIGFPGIAGTICLILAFFSMQVLPTNYAGLALIILALILFIAEVKVPGFGLLTLGGLVSMVLGSLLLFKSQYQIMRVSTTLIISLSLSTAVVTIFLLGAVVRSHKRKVVSGKEALTGEIGEAITDIGKKGKVFVHGEIWNATSQEPIKKGDKVEVIKVERLIAVVKKALGLKDIKV